MIHRLYTQEDNAQLNTLMATFEQKQALMDKVSSTLDGSENDDKPQADKAYPNDGFDASMFKKELTTTFTYKGSNSFKWSVDKSHLKPSVATQMSGKSFASAYLAQLNKVLYHTQDEPVMEALFDLMQLYELTKRSATVKVISGKYVQRLPVIASTLTEFFNTNKRVISAISTMVANELTEKAS